MRPSKKVKLDPIEVANSKPLEDFAQEYLPPSEDWKTWIHPSTKEQYDVVLETSGGISSSDFDACFHLIEFTSGEDYRKSKSGWKPRSKRKEMKLLDLKYLLIKHDSRVEGFLSFMPTYEDGYPVIYCYEIHLSSALQGNQKGMKFYSKLEYDKEEFTPPPKMLRNGTRVESEYVIFAKDISR
ncbi:hypothetical protein BGZ60DRAFT_391717 [Tricladium varicosporioides]|nr:hypothetical protein BGZ60DRAFT_391717 [Hymenoscyphus varicosporioides]